MLIYQNIISKGENMIKFTIIIPVYNVEKYLQECLESIYKIKLDNKEIILVNDGSTDNSLKILEKYKEKYSYQTKLITQENQGLSEARNTGIRNASGEYILFIDSDDFIEPKVTEEFFKTAYSYKTDILIGDYLEYFSDEDIRKRKHYSLSNKIEKDGLFFIENGVKNKCFEVVACKNIYRRKFLIENNLFFKKGLLHEDILFTLIAFYYAKKVRYFNDKEFYYYRKNNTSSIMNKISKVNYQHLLYILNSLLKFISEKRINNVYFNRVILGIYMEIVLRRKFKNTTTFKKLLKLKYNFREKIKLLIIQIVSLKAKELEVMEL